jgi:hypothetical protein
MRRQVLVVVVDLEKDPVAVGVERAEVMFFVRIIGVAKVVIDRDSLDNSVHGFCTKGGDARRHDGNAGGQVSAQLVIQVANAIGTVRSHGGELL